MRRGTHISLLLELDRECPTHDSLRPHPLAKLYGELRHETVDLCLRVEPNAVVHLGPDGLPLRWSLTRSRREAESGEPIATRLVSCRIRI